MKLSINTPLLLILTIIATISAEPSGESANPFNQFTNPSGGVSLFTGSAAYAHPLLTLSTKGSLSLPIALSYSSNVELNARASNEVAPTSWTGLGWSLGFGKIISNHKGTNSPVDDDYTWISPEGVASELYVSTSGVFSVKGRPYVTVERIINVKVVYGWKITDESGTVYKYGVCCTDVPSCSGEPYQCATCTWNTLMWPETEFVGNGFNGSPVKFAWQWDLSEIVDADGNWIRFAYDKVQENVYYSKWKIGIGTPCYEYTQASYIQQITTNSGTTVSFTTEDKPEVEYYEPYATVTDGRNTNQPMYEKKRLKEITVTNSHSATTPLTRISLLYTQLGSGDFTKGLLSRIVTENGKADNGYKGKTVTWFTYCNSENDPAGIYGAITSVKNNAGGETAWEYGKLTLDGAARDNYTQSISNISTDVATGMTSDGEDYYAFSTEGQCHVRKWDNDRWVSKQLPVYGTVYAGPNYFTVVSVQNKIDIRLFYWDGEDWVEHLVNGDKTWGEIAGMLLYDNHFIVVTTTNQRWYFKRMGTAETWNAFYDPEMNGKAGFASGQNYVAMYNINQQEIAFKTWEGYTWSALQSVVRQNDGSQGIFNGSNGFVEYYKAGSGTWFSAYRYDGNNWTSNICFAPNCPLPGNRVKTQKSVPERVTAGNDFFIISGTEDADEQSRVFNWNGHTWCQTKTFNDGAILPAGGSLIAEQEQYGYSTWKWDASSFTWQQGVYGGYHYIGYPYKLTIGGDFHIAEYTNNSGQFVAHANIWDSKGWIEEDVLDDYATTQNLASVTSLCGQRSFVRIGKDGSGWKRVLIFHRKYQNSFKNAPYARVVTKRIVRNGLDGKEAVTNFTYQEPKYNALLGSAMFGLVTVSQNGGGSAVTRYEMDDKRLRGTVKKTEVYNGTLRQATRESTYEIYPAPGTVTTRHRNVYQVRPVKAISIANGIKTEKIMEYNNTNGAVKKTTEKNSDGSYRIGEQAFACEKYPELAARQMLVQPFGSKVYHMQSATATPVVVAANATRWAQVPTVDGKVSLKPTTGYTWRVPMTKLGMPSPESQYAYGDFNVNAESNPNWHGGGKPELLDIWQRPVETSDINGIHSVVITGNNGYQPIGAVKNARFSDAALYTCNYDENYVDPATGKAYLDYRNGWEKCGAVVGGTVPRGHFSNGTVYVNLPVGGACGPSRNVRVSNTHNYILSAWVYVVEGTFMLYGDYRYMSGQNVPYMESQSIKPLGVQPATATPTGAWQLVKLEIPVKNDIDNSSNWGIRFYAGWPNGVKAYIDDIRFYPEDAEVSTSYYDDDWRQPQLVVDNNNWPGNKTTYDGYGRPVFIDKIDPSKSVGEVGYNNHLQEKKYTVDNAGVALMAPAAGSVFTVGDVIQFTFESYIRQQVRIYYVPASGDPVLLAMVPVDPNVNDYRYTFDWTVPPEMEEGSYGVNLVSEDKQFSTIVGPIVIKRGKIIYPHNNAVLEIGSAEAINYMFVAPSTKPVEIRVNGELITPAGTVNTGTFVWNIPKEFPVTETAVITATCNGITVTSESFSIKKRGFLRRAVFNLLNRVW